MFDSKQAAQTYFEQGRVFKQQGELLKAAGYFRSAIRLLSLPPRAIIWALPCQGWGN